MCLPIVAYVGKVRRTVLLSGRGGLQGYDLSKLKEEETSSSAVPTRSRAGWCCVFRGNRHQDLCARVIVFNAMGFC